MEGIFEMMMNRNVYGIQINEEYLNNLIFANDIVFVIKRREDTQKNGKTDSERKGKSTTKN